MQSAAATRRPIRHKGVWVELERCKDCRNHAHCTMHDEAKYDGYEKKVEVAVGGRWPLEVNPGPKAVGVRFRQVRYNPHLFQANGPATEKGGATVSKTTLYPRLGAFEVWVCHGGVREEVFSKLETSKWPNVDALITKIEEEAAKLGGGELEDAGQPHRRPASASAPASSSTAVPAIASAAAPVAPAVLPTPLVPAATAAAAAEAVPPQVSSAPLSATAVSATATPASASATAPSALPVAVTSATAIPALDVLEVEKDDQGPSPPSSTAASSSDLRCGSQTSLQRPTSASLSRPTSAGHFRPSSASPTPGVSASSLPVALPEEAELAMPDQPARDLARTLSAASATFSDFEEATPTAKPGSVIQESLLQATAHSTPQLQARMQVAAIIADDTYSDFDAASPVAATARSTPQLQARMQVADNTYSDFDGATPLAHTSSLLQDHLQQEELAATSQQIRRSPTAASDSFSAFEEILENRGSPHDNTTGMQGGVRAGNKESGTFEESGFDSALASALSPALGPHTAAADAHSISDGSDVSAGSNQNDRQESPRSEGSHPDVRQDSLRSASSGGSGAGGAVGIGGHATPSTGGPPKVFGPPDAKREESDEYVDEDGFENSMD